MEQLLNHQFLPAIIVVFSVIAAFLIDFLFRVVFRSFASKTKTTFDDNLIDIVLPNLIQIASVHMNIVNSLDNTFMITKKNSEKIFLNLKTLIYKYRGLE